MAIEGNITSMLGDTDINNLFDSGHATTEYDPSENEDNIEEKDDTKPEDNGDLNVNNLFDKVENSKDEDIEDDPDEDDSKQKSSDSAPSNFSAILAKDLLNQGVISSFDEEEFDKLVEEKGEAQALRDLMSNELKSQSDSIKKEYDEEYQAYLDMVENGVDKGVATDLNNVLETFKSFSDDQLENEDNENLRRDIIAENYRVTTGFSEAKIKKLVDRAVEMGEDIDEAKEARDSIVENTSSRITQEKEAAKKAAEEQETNLKNSQESLRRSIDELSEILPGQRINKQTKDKMYDLITKPIKDTNGNVTNAIWAKRNENPINFDKKIAYLMETGFFEDKPWNKFKSAKVTKEVNELEDFLNNNSSKRTGVMSLGKEDMTASDMIKSTAAILK